MIDSLATIIIVSSIAMAMGIVWGGFQLLRHDILHAPRRLVVGALLIFALSYLMRLLAPAGPHDIHLHVHYELSGYQSAWMYGIAWGAVVYPILSMLPSSSPNLDQLIALQLPIAALAPVMVISTLRYAKQSVRTSLFAGLLVAVDPILVRFGHTDAPQIVEITLWWLGLTAWLAHGLRPQRHTWLLGVCAVTMATMMRPEAILLLPITLVLVASWGKIPSLRKPSTWVAVAIVAIIPLLHLWGIWHTNAASKRSTIGWSSLPGILVYGPRALITFNTLYTPYILQALAVLGVVLAPLQRWRKVGLGFALFALAQFVPTWTWAPADTDIPCLLRHQLRALPLFDAVVAIAVVALASRVPSRWAKSAWLIGLILALGGRLWDIDRVWKKYTIHEEYAYFHEVMAQVPKDCLLVSYMTPADSGGVPPLHLFAAQGRGYRSAFLHTLRPGDLSGCVYWYRAAICDVTGAGLGDDLSCYRFEATHDLQVVSERWLAAEPWLYDHYRFDPVRVGLYRVLGPLDGASSKSKHSTPSEPGTIHPLRPLWR